MIEGKNISWSAGNRELLRNCSVVSKDGSFTTLLGPNGAGKTSLLRILSGIVAPESGQVLYNGRNIREASAAELSVERAYLQQQSGVFESFTVRNVLQMAFSGIRKLSDSQTGMLDELLREFDLFKFVDRPYNFLSGGEQQRVQFARCLLQLQLKDGLFGKTLMLDEPLNNLDLKYQYELLQAAREKVCARGGSVIAVLHDLNTTWACSDQVVLLKNGKILAAGTPCEVMTDALLTETYEVPVQQIKSENQVFFTVKPVQTGFYMPQNSHQTEII